MVLADIIAVGSILLEVDVNTGFLEALVLVADIVVAAKDNWLVGEIVDMSEERMLGVVCLIVAADAEVVSVVDDFILVKVGSSFEDVEPVDTGVVNRENKMRFDVKVAVVEDAALTDVLFNDAETLELVEKCLKDMKGVDVDNVGVTAENIEKLCAAFCNFVEYVDPLLISVKGAEAVNIVDVGV